MPDLDFAVVESEVLPFAAVPTLLFKLAISNKVPDERIHSIMLRAQIRIEVVRRQYDAGEEDRLMELFGEPRRWGETLRSMLWTNTTAVVPRFQDSTVAELPITCTYDFEVAAAKYFYALESGEIPLLFLFSGTVFYQPAEGGQQMAPIPWEKEASFRLPVRQWKEMMDRYFPNSAWLRLRKDVFDRLYLYKARRALPSWEAVLEDLLPVEELER